MKLQFCLAWCKSGIPNQKAFKSSAAYDLAFEYTKRISKFTKCEIVPVPSKIHPGTKVWLCDKGIGSKILSSEELAQLLAGLQNSGVKELLIVIGGPSGFSKKEIETLRPDLKWSFGPLTLPHELAAIVASEQIYRAFTILSGLPYHLSH